MIPFCVLCSPSYLSFNFMGLNIINGKKVFVK